MIVGPPLGALGQLFTPRGSIVPVIAPRVLVIAAISAVISTVHSLRPDTFPQLPAIPFTLLGLGLSIFLGFRNSACYDRWWEARKQWGTLVTESRSIAREVASVLAGNQPLQDRITRRLIAFAFALAARLRDTDASAAAQPWLPPDEAERLRGRSNPPDAVLRAITADLVACLRRGEVGEIVFVSLEERVATLCGVQAACERIRATPIPFAYTLLLHRTAWLFSLLLPFAIVDSIGFAAPLIVAILAYTFFGLDALGDELEMPFALRPNTLPLNALARIIEIELLEGLGESNLPKPLEPIEFLLT
jgi:putative membrane protein